MLKDFKIYKFIIYNLFFENFNKKLKFFFN